MSKVAGPYRAFQFSLLFVFLLCAGLSGRAQTVVYDWSSNSKVPESYPKITRKQTVTFRITNVNDILFSYRLEVTQRPIASDDFGKISNLLKMFKSSPTVTGGLNKCQDLEDAAMTSLTTAIKAINDDPKLPVRYAASSTHASIPLKDSIAAWHSHAPAINAALKAVADFTNECPASQTFKNAAQAFLESVNKIEEKVQSSHVFTDTHELSPGNDVSVAVVEMFGSETISTKTFTFPGTDVLTLSAGALFSAIPDRTYDARKSPTSTLNILTVEGNSRATPSLVGLMNYSLGALGLDGETTGLALSAGPVIKLGAKSGASSFGFFTGISAHLYHRFYVTPVFTLDSSQTSLLASVTAARCRQTSAS